MAYKRPESILIVVYTHNADVLLLRRHDPNDFWQSVTGSLEWHETPWEAARRELCEETGLPPGSDLYDCRQSHLFEIYSFWRHRYAPGVTENREHVFRLALPATTAVTIDASEHQEYRWLSRSQAMARVHSPTNREAIRLWVPDARG